MATIPYPAGAPALSGITLRAWRPSESGKENLVGQYRSVLRGRERNAGTARWGETSKPAVGQVLEAFLRQMDNPRNTCFLPLRRPTFRYGARNSVTVYSAVGGGGVTLDHWQPGMGEGCYVYLPRLRAVAQMVNYSFVGDFAQRDAEENQVRCGFSPPLIPIGSGDGAATGDVVRPATGIWVRKKTGARLDLPNRPGVWGPWILEFVEDVTP